MARTPYKTGATCRHCSRFPAARPRGLCFGCFADVGVRALYPTSGNIKGRRGTGHGGNRLDDPTPAPPGSAAKVAVLERRAALGLALYHPADAGFPADD